MPPSEPKGDPTLPDSLVALACKQLLGNLENSAAFIAGVALWSLRESRIVEISSAQSRRSWWSSSPPRTLMVGIASQATVGPSLEQELLHELHLMAADSYEDRDFTATVSDLIYAWMGRDYPNPYQELIKRQAERARIAGMYEVAVVPRSNPVTRFLFSPRVFYIANPGRADALESAGQSLVARWLRFMRDEPEVSSALINSARDALRLRVTVEMP